MNFLSMVTDFGDRVTFYVRSYVCMYVCMQSDVQTVCMLYICMYVIP